MIMDPVEMRTQYRYAKDKKKCISILAELNGCDRSKIMGIVSAGDGALGAGQDGSRELLLKKLNAIDRKIKRLEAEYREAAMLLMES